MWIRSTTGQLVNINLNPIVEIQYPTRIEYGLEVITDAPRRVTCGGYIVKLGTEEECIAFIDDLVSKLPMYQETS